MNKILQDLEESALAAGWRIVRRSTPVSIPEIVGGQYATHDLPHTLLDFWKAYESFSNSDETAWLLCLKDFEDAIPFSWDSFRAISRGAIQGEPALAAEVERFWNSHIPVLLSVKTGYCHFSCRLTPGGEGPVFEGLEPEFEETTDIAPSHEEFLRRLTSFLAGQTDDSRLRPSL